jgi:hypothetical protein
MLRNLTQKFNSIGDQIMSEIIGFIKFIIALILFTSLALLALLLYIAFEIGLLGPSNFNLS